MFLNRNNEPDAFAFFKYHPNGFKLGIIAANFPNAAAKNAVIDFLRLVFCVRGVFGEVSDRIEKRLKGRVPIVDPKLAEMVLKPKKILEFDQNRYPLFRDIEGRQ